MLSLDADQRNIYSCSFFTIADKSLDLVLKNKRVLVAFSGPALLIYPSAASAQTTDGNQRPGLIAESNPSPETPAPQASSSLIDPGTFLSIGILLGFALTVFSLYAARRWLRKPRAAHPKEEPPQKDFASAPEPAREAAETFSAQSLIAAVGPPPILCETYAPNPRQIAAVTSLSALRGAEPVSIEYSFKALEGMLLSLGGNVENMHAAFQKIENKLINSQADDDSQNDQENWEPALSKYPKAGQPQSSQSENAGRRAKARALRARGSRLLMEDKPGEALEAFDESLEIMLDLTRNVPANLNWQRDLILAYHNQGRTLERLKRYREAVDSFDEALHLARKLSEKNPENLDLKRGLASSYSHAGRLALILGRNQTALENFENDVSLMVDLTAKQPDNKAWQYVLANAHHNLAQGQEKSGLMEEALNQYKKEKVILEKMIEGEADNGQRIMELAAVRSRMASILKDLGRPSEAMVHARAYLRETRRLNKIDSNNPPWRRELTLALSQVGRLLEIQGDFDQALANFEAAAVIRQNLSEYDPQDPQAKCELAMILYKIGDIHLTKNQWELSQDNYQEALILIESLIRAHGPEENWLAEKCSLLIRMGNLYRNQNENRAFEYYNQALAITEANAGSSKNGWDRLRAMIHNNMALQ